VARYRDWLHASPRIVERAHDDLETGYFERGSGRPVGFQTPIGAEQIEVSLLRLYQSGAHAAAAEQYGHYATVMREQLGIEPPPLDAL
jgi:hypothetical protein